MLLLSGSVHAVASGQLCRAGLERATACRRHPTKAPLRGGARQAAAAGAHLAGEVVEARDAALPPRRVDLQPAGAELPLKSAQQLLVDDVALGKGLQGWAGVQGWGSSTQGRTGMQVASCSGGRGHMQQASCAGRQAQQSHHGGGSRRASWTAPARETAAPAPACGTCGGAAMHTTVGTHAGRAAPPACAPSPAMSAHGRAAACCAALRSFLTEPQGSPVTHRSTSSAAAASNRSCGYTSSLQKPHSRLLID